MFVSLRSWFHKCKTQGCDLGYVNILSDISLLNAVITHSVKHYVCANFFL